MSAQIMQKLNENYDNYLKQGYRLLSENLYKFAVDFFKEVRAIVPLCGVENKLVNNTMAELETLSGKLMVGEINEVNYKAERKNITDHYLINLRYAKKQQTEVLKNLN